MNIVHFASFEFSTAKRLEPHKTVTNTMGLMEKNASQYFLQYIQFRVEGKTLFYRKYNLLPDRLYFLEVANSTLNDQERRRRFFSLLGRRRFGANNNRYDIYTMFPTIDTDRLIGQFETARTDQRPIRFERKDRNINRYAVWFITSENGQFAAMHQQNISETNTFEKTFFVDIDKQDLFRLENIRTDAFKIEYLFHKIGKIYFESNQKKSLPLFETAYDPNYSITIPTFSKTEIQSLFDKNRALTDSFFASDKVELDKALFDLINQSHTIIGHLEDSARLTIFIHSFRNINKELRPYPFFNILTQYFMVLEESATQGKLLDNLVANPKDTTDIVNYLIEVFSEWHSTFILDRHDALMASTIDCADAMRHFFNIFLPAEEANTIKTTPQQSEKVEQDAAAATPSLPSDMIGSRKLISAAALLEEIELDPELMDELKELEEDILHLDLHQQLDPEIARILGSFFKGYARVLNTILEFKNLGDSLLLLGNRVEHVDPAVDSHMAMTLLQSIVIDLLQWKQVILIEKTAKDIHYMDDSFFGNIEQVEMLLNPPSDDESSDIEFF